MDDDQLFDHGGGVDEAGPGAVGPSGAVGMLGILCGVRRGDDGTNEDTLRFGFSPYRPSTFSTLTVTVSSPRCCLAF